MGFRTVSLTRTTGMRPMKWPKMLHIIQISALISLSWDPRVTIYTERVVVGVWSPVICHNTGILEKGLNQES